MRKEGDAEYPNLCWILPENRNTVYGSKEVDGIMGELMEWSRNPAATSIPALIKVKVVDKCVAEAVVCAILVTRSPVLKRAFESGMEEALTGTLQIDDTTPEACELFLQFLHLYHPDDNNPRTKHLLEKVDARDLWTLADKYEVHDIKIWLADYAVNSENSVAAAIFVTSTASGTLSVFAEEYIDNNLATKYEKPTADMLSVTRLVDSCMFHARCKVMYPGDLTFRGLPPIVAKLLLLAHKSGPNSNFIEKPFEFVRRWDTENEGKDNPAIREAAKSMNRICNLRGVKPKYFRSEMEGSGLIDEATLSSMLVIIEANEIMDSCDRHYPDKRQKVDYS